MQKREKLYGVNEICCDKNDMCCDSNHYQLIDKYCNTLIDILNKSTVWKEVKISNNKCKSNLRWNNKINNLKKEAKMKYKKWRNSSSLRDGKSYEAMINTREYIN